MAADTETRYPFRDSPFIPGLSFTGRHRNYTNADTWYPSWAEDDNLYSPWTDGYILKTDSCEPFDQSHPGYPCNSLDFMGRKAATAQARIIGDDPLDLTVENLSPRIEASPAPYQGRYPSASLVHNGVWYYGTYCVDSDGDPVLPDWVTLGPLVGFRWSIDYGKSWVETPHTPEKSLFSENPALAPVKMGTPHFVDFGRNMMHSPDGKAYLVGHGSVRPDAANTWIRGDQVYLARVSPAIETINDPTAYEFFGGYNEEKKAVWTHDFTKIRPLLEWEGHMGCVTITYNAPLQRYLMCVTSGLQRGRYDSMILEAHDITGEWRMVQYLPQFGPMAYFLNFPSRFISPDGRLAWLCYSANWHDKRLAGDPQGSQYAMSLHEVVLDIQE